MYDPFVKGCQKHCCCEVWGIGGGGRIDGWMNDDENYGFVGGGGVWSLCAVGHVRVGLQMVSLRPSLGGGDAIAGDLNGGSLARFEAPAPPALPLPGGVLSSSVSDSREEEGWWWWPEPFQIGCGEDGRIGISVREPGSRRQNSFSTSSPAAGSISVPSAKIQIPPSSAKRDFRQHRDAVLTARDLDFAIAVERVADVPGTSERQRATA